MNKLKPKYDGFPAIVDGCDCGGDVGELEGRGCKKHEEINRRHKHSCQNRHSSPQ